MYTTSIDEGRTVTRLVNVKPTATAVSTLSVDTSIDEYYTDVTVVNVLLPTGAGQAITVRPPPIPIPILNLLLTHPPPPVRLLRNHHHHLLLRLLLPPLLHRLLLLLLPMGLHHHRRRLSPPHDHAHAHLRVHILQPVPSLRHDAHLLLRLHRPDHPPRRLARLHQIKLRPLLHSLLHGPVVLPDRPRDSRLGR